MRRFAALTASVVSWRTATRKCSIHRSEPRLYALSTCALVSRAFWTMTWSWSWSASRCITAGQLASITVAVSVRLSPVAIACASN
jgi:hypothetical protein